MDRDLKIAELEERVRSIEARLEEAARELRSGGFSSMTIHGLASSLTAAARALGNR